MNKNELSEFVGEKTNINRIQKVIEFKVPKEYFEEQNELENDSTDVSDLCNNSDEEGSQEDTSKRIGKYTLA